MDGNVFTVLDLVDLDLKDHNSLNLRCIAGRKGLTRTISTPELNRPGLALCGFYDVFAFNRIQVFGFGEVAYLKKLLKEQRIENLKPLLKYEIPCCIFTHNAEVESFFIEAADNADCPVLVTDLPTTEFTIRVLRILSNIFAPKVTRHGVLVEVYGLGILITGESGVGKSETALELIRDGHRLIADDVVDIHCINGNMLIGSGANKIIGHHMEIRGIGVINITHLFGVSAVRDQKRIQLITHLEGWNEKKDYDRVGIDSEDLYEDILGVRIPKLDIPVKAGRNLRVVIETAALNERLKNMGYNTAREFNRNILKWIESEDAKKVYFGKDDII
ncbi:MAG: HPr(Ser) kinase/phosphatase [Spirochaetaceae bacterium]|jgi:HPr kinase/phosphorylase|nr:HPr(Ser) kinase/phosphatase [Spirochaetaceae bacterium]